MDSALPITRDLVLIGGGHTHALFLKRWGMRPLPGVRLTLIDPGHATAYTGMLPGFVAGHYSRSQLDIDLVRLSRHAGARFVNQPATGLDIAKRMVFVENRAPIHFDVLSLDIGVHSELDTFSDEADIVPIKPLSVFSSAWSKCLDELTTRQKPFSVHVLGGGIGGVEIALAMAHRLSHIDPRDLRISISEKSGKMLPRLSKKERRPLMNALKSHGVRYEVDHEVDLIRGQTIHFKDGSSLDANFIVSAAGAKPYRWLEETKLPLVDGFISIDKHLRVEGHEAIFAAGDCAHMSFAPREKAGVFAVRQAPVLYENVRAKLSSGKLRKFKPQRDYLKLVSTGEKSAIAVKFGIAFRGQWLWRVKDTIDRRFMERLNTYPDMPLATPPKNAATGVAELMLEHPPLCGGCGAKVDRNVLFSSLAPRRALPAIGAVNDDAATVRFTDVFQTISTDHLRAFSHDPWIVAKVAAVHALGDVWSMGASPQLALSSITLPHMSSKLQSETLKEIIDASTRVFEDAGASIVGGHTSVGAELSIGFTVTGLRAKSPISLSGAQSGDVILLTKPIGVGVVLAAEMAKRAKGRWVTNAISQMTRSQAVASQILAQYAHAMTDVTGFGLAGHLSNILEASSVQACLNWSDIPLIEGAAELAREGVRSSLWAANYETAPIELETGTAKDLLFDPQTAGGLLACVREKDLSTILQAFREAQEPVWGIGHITNGEPLIKLV